MTEHSIAELERQEQRARSKVSAAQTALREAKKRLADARLDATGLSGHVVRGKVRYGSSEQTIVVREISGWDNSNVRGPMVKQNGQLGQRDYELAIKDVTDLGPYKGGSNE